MLFFWHFVRETRDLSDMQLYVLYMDDEQKTAVLTQQAVQEQEAREANKPGTEQSASA